MTTIGQISVKTCDVNTGSLIMDEAYLIWDSVRLDDSSNKKVNRVQQKIHHTSVGKIPSVYVETLTVADLL